MRVVKRKEVSGLVVVLVVVEGLAEADASASASLPALEVEGGLLVDPSEAKSESRERRGSDILEGVVCSVWGIGTDGWVGVGVRGSWGVLKSNLGLKGRRFCGPPRSRRKSKGTSSRPIQEKEILGCGNNQRQLYSVRF